MVRPTLSVLCATREPGAQVAALLEPLRAVADEIVVAVDATRPADELGHYARVADRLLRFEWKRIDYELPWAFAQCSGSWVLKIDGDEVPSAALIDALPELIASTDVLQYYLPYRLLFPDQRRWVSSWPHSYFWLPRLVRGESSVFWHTGVGHTNVRPVWPSRYAAEPFYHLDCVLNSEEERLAKLRRYQSDPPDPDDIAEPRWHVPVYLPERFPGLATAPVDDADQPLIDAVLAARAEPELPTPEGLAVPLATREEVTRLSPLRTLADDAYHARIEPYRVEPVIYAGEDAPVYVRVTNLGTETWPGGAERRPHIRLTTDWISADGTHEERPRTMLPAPVPPGASAIVPVFLGPPETPGSYRVEIRLVHELIRWFDETLTLALQVLPANEDPTRSVDLGELLGD